MHKIELEIRAVVDAEESLVNRYADTPERHPFFNDLGVRLEKDLQAVTSMAGFCHVGRGSDLLQGTLYLLFDSANAFMFAMSCVQSINFVEERMRTVLLDIYGPDADIVRATVLGQKFIADTKSELYGYTCSAPQGWSTGNVSPAVST